jgi:hypothetical protein
VSREWNAVQHDRLSGPQTAWGERVLPRLCLRGDERVIVLARLPDESLRAAFVGEVVRACAGSPDELLLDYVRLNMDGTKPGSGRA